MFSDTRIHSLEQTNAAKGKLVIFYKNGDVHYKGLRASVSLKQFRRFETLLKWLDEKIPTPRGVRHIFQLPEGLEIHDVAGFVNGRSYVVASSQRLLKVSYGDSRERFWINKPPSASRLRRSEYSLFKPGAPKYRHFHSYPASRTSSHNSYQYPLSEPTRRRKYGVVNKPAGRHVTQSLNMAHPPTSDKPRLLTIISNTNRDSREKVILNPHTTQTYEDMLIDIGSMVDLLYPPVTALWTCRKPHIKVKGFSHLMRSLRHFETFLAVGQEGKPSEIIGSVTRLPDTPDLLSNNASEPIVHPKPTKTHKAPNHKTIPSQQSPTDLRNGYHHHTPVYSRENSPEPVVPANKTVHKQLTSEQAAKEPNIPLPSNDQDVVAFEIHGKTRNFYVPRYDKSEPDGSKPDKRLKLDWVYGYHGRDAHHNLHILTSGELIYYVATVAIVFHPKSEHQRHYTEHNENITSIALHPNRNKPIVATGQLSGQSTDSSAHVRVWDANTMVTYAIVGFGVFQTSVLSLTFSKESGDMGDGSLLLAIDESPKHTMSLWNWQKDSMIAKTSTTPDTVVFGQCHPKDYTNLVTCGKQHVHFWKIFWNQETETSGKILRDKQSGIFQDGYDASVVTSIAFAPNGDVITGDCEGGLVVWQRDQHDAYVMSGHWSTGLRHAHKNTVYSLFALDDGTLLSSGGTETRAWDTNNDYQLIKQAQINSSCGAITAMAVQINESSHSDSVMCVGTSHNTILQGSFQGSFSITVQGQSFNPSERQKSEKEGSFDELWALATHPSSYAFVTAGTDQQIYKWNALTHRLEWRSVVEKPCLSVDINPTGKVILVGTTSGRFIALSALDGMHIISMQAGTQQIGVVRFSPDGNYLALGSHDSGIYVYNVEDEAQVFRRHNVGILRGHSHFVTHIDWSRDGKHLRSVSGEYDLRFWSIDEMREVTSESMRDIVWFSHNCILSYDTLGAWSNLKQGEDISTTDTSHNKDFLVVGDNKGTLRLYKHPAITNKPNYEQKKPYTGHVMRVAFTFDDHYLLSCGGSDAALLQWTITPDR